MTLRVLWNTNVKWNIGNNPKDVLVKSGKLCMQCEGGKVGI